MFFNLKKIKLLIFGFIMVGSYHCKKPVQQKMGSKFEVAVNNKTDLLKKIVHKNNLDYQQIEIFIRAFKHEKLVEIWAKNKATKTYKQIITYPFCASSGKLGPKRIEGDLQIPEGIYHIDRFNPKSKFHLSLGLNYPNESDKRLGDSERPGSDIFIHGGCATVGCIPITNDKIEELYVLADQARTNGQSRIPVHIFPFKMNPNYLQSFSEKHPNLRTFWQQLQPFYQHFETSQQIPEMSLNNFK